RQARLASQAVIGQLKRDQFIQDHSNRELIRTEVYKGSSVLQLGGCIGRMKAVAFLASTGYFELPGAAKIDQEEATRISFNNDVCKLDVAMDQPLPPVPPGQPVRQPIDSLNAL